MKYFKQAMGAPVEIEFAVDLNPDKNDLPTLYLLQIKPLIRIEKHTKINFDELINQKFYYHQKKEWAMVNWTISKMSFS